MGGNGNGNGQTDQELIIEHFLRVHDEVYPLDADVRQTLRYDKWDKLESDANALLAYGASVETICSIISRDMKKRPELRMSSPSTIRFCVRSIEKLAKIGNSMGARQKPSQTADIAKTATMMSWPDKKAINDKLTNGGWGSLTREEQWRWHAYIRAWRENVQLMGTDPTDPHDQWLEPTLLQHARDMYGVGRHRHKPRNPSAAEIDGYEARERFARECGLGNFAAVIEYGIQRAGRLPIKPQATRPTDEFDQP